jgi:hypothetical protein
MIRSHLWQPEEWPRLDDLPTLAETMKDAASIPAPVEIIEGSIKDDEETAFTKAGQWNWRARRDSNSRLSAS